MITLEHSLADAVKRLAKVSESSRLDAEVLLTWVLDTPRSYLFAHPEVELNDESICEFSNAIARRHKGEPIAFITGTKEFWSLQLKVSRDTLVPRPETETLVEQALLLISRDRPCRILDLGTGSGAIAIIIANERPKCTVVATDLSSAALKIANENAVRNALCNIRFIKGNWIEPVYDQSFDFILSNPPYVRDDDPTLDGLQYEPRFALTSGPDGLNAIRTIAKTAGKIMVTDGILLLEHSADQEDAVAIILQEGGWTDIKCFKDLSGQPRVSTAKMGVQHIQDEP
jgi:release factor glutamine methyltransferase